MAHSLHGSNSDAVVVVMLGNGAGGNGGGGVHQLHDPAMDAAVGQHGEIDPHAPVEVGGVGDDGGDVVMVRPPHPLGRACRCTSALLCPCVACGWRVARVGGSLSSCVGARCVGWGIPPQRAAIGFFFVLVVLVLDVQAYVHAHAMSTVDAP